MSDATNKTLVPYFRGSSDESHDHKTLRRNGNYVYSYSMPIAVRLNTPVGPLYAIVESDVSPSATTSRHIGNVRNIAESENVRVVNMPVRLPETDITNESMAHECMAKLFSYAQSLREYIKNSNARNPHRITEQITSCIQGAEIIRRAYGWPANVVHVSEGSDDEDDAREATG